MVSLQHCRELLCSDGERYTDEQVEQIRAVLYQLGYIDYELSLKRNEEAAANPTSNSLHPCLDG